MLLQAIQESQNLSMFLAKQGSIREELKKALERAASNLDPDDRDKYPGWGLQVAGMRLEIDVSPNNRGERITKFEVENPADGSFEELDGERVYSLAVGSFMAPSGSQGWKFMSWSHWQKLG